jgi:hypothetical protein
MMERPGKYERLWKERTEGKLHNGPLQWTPVHYGGDGVAVGRRGGEKVDADAKEKSSSIPTGF